MDAITINSPVYRLFVLLESFHMKNDTTKFDLMDQDWDMLRRIIRDRTVISGKALISEFLEKKDRIIEVYQAETLMRNIEKALNIPTAPEPVPTAAGPSNTASTSNTAHTTVHQPTTPTDPASDAPHSQAPLTVKQIYKIHYYKKLHDTTVSKFDYLCGAVLKKTDKNFNFNTQEVQNLEQNICGGLLRKSLDENEISELSFAQLKHAEQQHILFKQKVKQMSNIVKFFEKVIHEIEA